MLRRTFKRQPSCLNLFFLRNDIQQFTPNEQKIKEAKKIQQCETKELFNKKHLSYPLHTIAYTISDQSPASIAEMGGLLRHSAPSHFPGTFSLSLSPLEPLSWLPKSGGLSVIYLHAFPLNDIYPILKNSYIITPILPITGWLSREIRNIRNQVVDLGPMQGFYNFSCDNHGSYHFLKFMNNNLKLTSSNYTNPLSSRIAEIANEFYTTQSLPRRIR